MQQTTYLPSTALSEFCLSAPSCAVIILNGAPSCAPVYFLFRDRYTSFYCRENFFLFKICFVLPIVCTFFCPIVCSNYFEWCPIERTFVLFIYGIPHFSEVTISWFKIFFLCYPSCALFSAPSYAVNILNGAPSSAPVYFLFKVGLSHFFAGKFYWFKIFFCVTHRVHFFLPHRVQFIF